VERIAPVASTAWRRRCSSSPTTAGCTCRRAPATSLDDYVRAIEIDARSWDTTEEAVADRLARAREQWPAMHADGRTYVYLAHADGEPVGFARAVVVGEAALMNGGTVLAHARGRGVYRALVDARRRDLAERGVTSLVTQASSMSRPILEQLGFEPLGEIRLLVGPPLTAMSKAAASRSPMSRRQTTGRKGARKSTRSVTRRRFRLKALQIAMAVRPCPVVRRRVRKARGSVTRVRPILERLGFEPLGEIRLLVDRLQP
jgi:GNAT superfamily N-acetyltransferase